MGKMPKIPEPIPDIPFVDTHCHLPWTEGKSRTPPPEEQLAEFKKMNGQFLITSSIDLKSTLVASKFAEQNSGVYFSCGMAPQTVTYTPAAKYAEVFKEWKTFVEKREDQILSFGEIGLDFHHAKALNERQKQIRALEDILSFIVDKKKPIVLHVRNPSGGDKDVNHPEHPFNNSDAATRQILKILEKFKVNPSKVLFHCYSGPVSINDELVNLGFYFSVPSSAHGFMKWYKVSRSLPLEKLVSETDSPFQHPWMMKPMNTPSNARFAVAAVAYSHGAEQEDVARKMLENAKKFFSIK
ncbi:MAG: TatD family hydrolase [Promethearchaeota archaeon]